MIKPIIIGLFDTARDYNARGINPPATLIGGSLAKIVTATGATRKDLIAVRDPLARVLGSIASTGGAIPDGSTKRADILADIGYFARDLSRTTGRGYIDRDIFLSLLDSSLTSGTMRIDRDNNLDVLGGAMAKAVRASLGDYGDLMSLVGKDPKYANVDFAVCALNCSCNDGNFSGAIGDVRALYDNLVHAVRKRI